MDGWCERASVQKKPDIAYTNVCIYASDTRTYTVYRYTYLEAGWLNFYHSWTHFFSALLFQVNWYKGSMKLSDGERHSMVTVGNRYRLSIQPVEKRDFGNYSCISENVLGRAKGRSTQVTLTGNN